MPTRYKNSAGQPYQPSNGTEFDIFFSNVCRGCKLKPHCSIDELCYSNDIGDELYPTQLVRDDKGWPQCMDRNVDIKESDNV